MTPQRARKLKETCDSCSASKVKCEKQWPRCGRCDNLGYPCFYSPAMRKGRPHPTINGNGQKKSTVEAAKPAKPQKSTTDPETPFSRPPSQNDGEQHHASKTNGALAAQQNHHRQDSMPIFPPNMSAHQIPPTASIIPRLEAPSPSTTSTDTSSDIFSPSSTNASSVTSHDDDIHTWLPKPPPHNTQNTHPHGSSDCASIAMQSLQDLTLASSLPPTDPSLTHFLNTQLQTTATSIKHLSAILICPCSRNPDIGLLNAALVAAILDSYSTILCNAVPPSPIPQLSTEITHMMTGNNDSASINPMAVLNPHNNNNPNPPYPNAGPHQRHQQQQTTTQRILDELPKAANVVMQFSRRYSALTDECVPTQQQQQQQQFGKEDMVGLLPTVAMEQRVRLKEIVDRATGLMALVA
ncbi:hypothetical protein XPA_002427 [Xanthoria parietina]